ncbi:blight-associated protein p12 precursor [Zea mays]|uniref:Blight-associated protein p12 n=1 Tax=Zea mays TaxID=4577 RepID=B6T987_MAIZE|nr:blight-associated protein p12 precursor [Zea mays]ACG33670.1 blight-associated protein p12 precursor [Zea mays]|eukprot:NP_001148968.1 blight-associated protein p12 precursor [Zea mays]
MAIPKATSIVLAMVLTLAMVSLVAGTTGYATFYTPSYTPSACYGYQDMGTMIAAASDVFWNGGAACGDRYVVSCKGGTNEGVPHPCTGRSVTVQIVDLCPAGCQGTIDLSQDAFAIIADPDAGKVEIEYRRI